MQAMSAHLLRILVVPLFFFALPLAAGAANATVFGDDTSYGEGVYGGVNCTLSASPTSISEGGSSTLTWTATNASSTSFSPDIGSVATSGSKVVSPSSDTTYAFTVTTGASTSVCRATVTVTPASHGGGGGGSSGGGGGGGGGSYTPYVPPTSTATTTTTGGTGTATTTASTTPTNSGSATTAATTAGYTFPRVLRVGSEGADVRELQKLLNRLSFTIAPSGVGSPGNETTYYGNLTASALARFQERYVAEVLAPVGLTKGTGYFGNSTRSFVNARFEGGGTSAPIAPTCANGPAFTRSLARGMSGSDVSALQTLLAALAGIYPEALVTGTYGPLTVKAVGRFQLQNNIATTENPAFGSVGPMTRAALNTLLATQAPCP